MTIDFATFPPEAGQMVRVDRADGIGQIYAYWEVCAMNHGLGWHIDSATLLLPSRQQREAAGLSVWDALANIAKPQSAHSTRRFAMPLDPPGSGNWVSIIQEHDTENKLKPIEAGAHINTTDPAILTRAANRLTALQAWIKLQESAQ